MAPLALHLDGWQARFQLRSAESRIDMVMEDGILNVKHFICCTRLHPRHSRAPRTWQNPSHSLPPPSPQPLAAVPAPLAASQLSWAQQWVPQDNPRCPATISTRANHKITTLWLQQWLSSAQSPTNTDLVEAPPGTNVLKLHEGLKKAGRSLAIQLRTAKNALDAFLF